LKKPEGKTAKTGRGKGVFRPSSKKRSKPEIKTKKKKLLKGV